MVFIIHGVGYFEKGRIISDSEQIKKNFKSRKKIDYCWAELVDHPQKYMSTDNKYLSILGASIINCAWVGFKKKNIFEDISNLIASVFLILIYILPLILLCWLVVNYDNLLIHFIVPKHFPIEYLPSLIKFYSDTLIGLGLSSIFFSLISNGIIGFIIGIRRILLIVIWVLLYPIFIMGTMSFKSIFFFTAIFVATFYRSYALAFAHIHGYSEAMYIFAYPFIFLLIFGVIRFIQFKFGFILKHLADVFLYIGNENYRNELINSFSELCNKNNISNSEEIIFLTHSLGSVIATDYLIREDLISEHSKVILITMGSPLKRFFSTFFPNSVSTPVEKYEFYFNKYNKFKWINIYRPLDFIGSSVSKNNKCDIINISSGQIKDPFSSHTGYWNDVEIFRIIKSKL